MTKKPKGKKKPKPYRLAALALLPLAGCQLFGGPREGKDYLGEPVPVTQPDGTVTSKPRLVAAAEAAEPFIPEKAKPYTAIGLSLLGLLLAGSTKPKEQA